MICKKTFSSISKKFAQLQKECAEVEANAETEVEVLSIQQEEIQQKIDVELNEARKARLLGKNLTKILTQPI